MKLRFAIHSGYQSSGHKVHKQYSEYANFAAAQGNLQNSDIFLMLIDHFIWKVIIL